MPDYLRFLLPLIAVPLVIMQVRKPTRGIGPLFLRGMSRSHSSLTDWRFDTAVGPCVGNSGGGLSLADLTHS
jgi:hypothetical protein